MLLRARLFARASRILSPPETESAPDEFACPLRPGSLVGNVIGDV